MRRRRDGGGFEHGPPGEKMGDSCFVRVDADHIRYLNDPEHPLTLEQLNITTVRGPGERRWACWALWSRCRCVTCSCPEQLESVFVNNRASTVDIRFTPTIPHCSMATLIGLCIRVKLMRSLPSRFKVRARAAMYMQTAP